MSARRLYFAYGSNLDPVQMKRRCPGSDAVGPAFAPGYALTFPAHSTGDWKGGVASIEPLHEAQQRTHEPHAQTAGACGGAGVWGVLYLITDDDLRALDDYEAVDEGMYTRSDITVLPDPLTPSAPPQTALTYFAVRGYNAPKHPSKKYRAAIVGGAEHHRLPPDYLAALRALPTID